MADAGKSQDISIQQAMQFAQTPAGQQLISLLRSTGGKEFQAAMQQAAMGDYSTAKDVISRMLTDPEAQKLLEQLRRTK